MSTDHVAGVVAALADTPPKAGATKILAIDGRSGAGKSTLAHDVAEQIGAPVVHTELIYPGWDGLETGIDLLVADVLAPLAAGRAGSIPQWDYVRGGWGAPLPIEPAATIVVEGVGTGARRTAPYVSLLVWVELDDVERYARAMTRDGDVYRPHWDRWAAQEDALLARERTPDRAAIVVRAG